MLAGTALFATSLIPMALAQVDSREAIALQNQIYQLRQEVQMLRDQVARGGGGAPVRGGSSGGNDMVARWGGEEFIVLLRDCVLSDALRLAEDIRAAIADVPFGSLGSLTVSVGAAEVRADEDLTSWLGRADQALYRAKRAGRNEVVTDADTG